MTAPTILFVDDEVGVLRSMQRLFRKENINVLTAQGGAEGLAVLAKQTASVVVSDQRMQGMRGTDFLKKVCEQYPDTIRCILSGYAEMDSVVAAINDGHVYRFIAKPWDDDELKGYLEDCLRAAKEISDEREARQSLAKKASALEEESAEYAELFRLQDTLLKSSRVVLDQLPIAVAAIDPAARLIYTNRRFAREFGHLPGAVLGQAAGEPWASAASNNVTGNTELTVDQSVVSAQIEKVEIGGHQHTLIAMTPR